MFKKIFIIFFIAGCHITASHAQKINQQNTLFTAGHASAFIGGLFDAFYPYHQLMKYGDFGLGAPDQLDGELLMLDGKIYQTQVSGKTFEIKDGSTPFAVVNFFKAERKLTLKTTKNKEQLFAFLDSVMDNQNAIYAIRIKGNFEMLKTRAFPKSTIKPYPPLASMLALQRFFTHNHIQGDLVGYRIPKHMDGANITGYHFHFLSSDKKSGGHLIEVVSGEITIEIDELNAFTSVLPVSKDFKNFDFNKDRKEEMKKVENGN